MVQLESAQMRIGYVDARLAVSRRRCGIGCWLEAALREGQRRQWLARRSAPLQIQFADDVCTANAKRPRTECSRFGRFDGCPHRSLTRMGVDACSADRGVTEQHSSNPICFDAPLGLVKAQAVGFIASRRAFEDTGLGVRELHVSPTQAASVIKPTCKARLCNRTCSRDQAR